MLKENSSLPQKVIEKLSEDSIILAFDYGLARIGVAIGNTVVKDTRPLTIIHWKKNQEKWKQITQIMEDWKPALVVVGVPRHKDGAPNSMTPVCENFANQINGRFNVYVARVDERFSSVEVEEGSDDYIDDLAAQVILEQWFRENFIDNVN